MIQNGKPGGFDDTTSSAEYWHIESHAAVYPENLNTFIWREK